MVVHKVSFDLPAHEYGIDGRFLSVCRAKVERTRSLWHQCYLESTLMPPVALRSTEASRRAACRERHPISMMRIRKSVVEMTMQAFNVRRAGGQWLVVSVLNVSNSCNSTSRHAASSQQHCRPSQTSLVFNRSPGWKSSSQRMKRLVSLMRPVVLIRTSPKLTSENDSILPSCSWAKPLQAWSGMQ
jgi:hypothetical protein